MNQSHLFENGAGREFDMIIPSLGMSGTFKKGTAGHLKIEHKMNPIDEPSKHDVQTIDFEEVLEGKMFSEKQTDMKKRAHILAQTAEGLADVDISADIEGVSTCY